VESVAGKQDRRTVEKWNALFTRIQTIVEKGGLAALALAIDSAARAESEGNANDISNNQ
jgi:hypothetical protein